MSKNDDQDHEDRVQALAGDHNITDADDLDVLRSITDNDAMASVAKRLERTAAEKRQADREQRSQKHREGSVAAALKEAERRYGKKITADQPAPDKPKVATGRASGRAEALRRFGTTPKEGN